MGRLSQEFVEASVITTANAVLSQEFAEPAVFVNAEARLTQVFLEVAVEAGGSPEIQIWPQERLRRMFYLQGQRLKVSPGQR